MVVIVNVLVVELSTHGVDVVPPPEPLPDPLPEPPPEPLPELPLALASLFEFPFVAVFDPPPPPPPHALRLAAIIKKSVISTKRCHVVFKFMFIPLNVPTPNYLFQLPANFYCGV